MGEDVLSELQNAIVENCVHSLQKAAKQAEEINNIFEEMLRRICNEIVGVVEKVVEEIRQYFVEKSKDWKIPIKQEIRPLYFDKRRKVHRCRNNC